MTNFASLLMLPQSFTIIPVIGAGIAGLVSGFLIKSGVLASQKKRILNLENEMLKNHARILQLEKKNTKLKENVAYQQEKSPVATSPAQKVKLMAS
ncbi:MAG: hypothetical protein JSS67_11460 [Bacteroidetes bacterium]|nr:hypothetical protein [Bacteroidota bacterium]